MRVPPGSQVALAKPNHRRRSRQPRGENQELAGVGEKGTLLSDNGQSGGHLQCPEAPPSFKTPNQRHVYTECVPLRELYSQVLLNESASYGSGGKGSRSGGHRKHCGQRPPSAFQQSFKELPYPRGMVNSSNFCFINSVLQMLVFIPPFAQLAVSVSCDGQASELCPTLNTLGKWILQYWKPGFTRLAMTAPTLMEKMPLGGLKPTSGASGTRAVNSSQRILDGSIQEDAQEFLQKLLERVHEELVGLEETLCTEGPLETTTQSSTKKMATAAGVSSADVNTPVDPPGNGASSNHQQKGWTFVKGKEKLAVREHKGAQGQSKLLESVFGGTLESYLQGKERQRDRVSVLIETYYCLPVDIGFSPDCTLEQALERTFMTERIYDSDREKNLKKTLRLGRLPSILFLHLRRWAVTREGELVKLDNNVRLRRTLTIPRTICSDETLTKTERTYCLLSVVCHRGDAASRGHYVTYLLHHAASPALLKAHASDSPNVDTGVVRSSPDAATGILCNDASISLCPMSNMEKEAMYFLVYQRIS